MTPTVKAAVHPPFSWRLFLGSYVPGAEKSHPLDRASARFYLRASNAIWNGIKLLQLSPDQNILFPAYHCGIELDTVLKAGVGVKFYPVGRDAKVTPEAIRARIDAKTRAVFVTHYFGFPQDLSPIVSLCRDHNLYLIEDCAHGLYGEHEGRPLGTTGDLAVFSLWKMIPIPFGGALVVNRQGLPLPAEPVPPSRYEIIRLMKKLVEIRLANSWLLDRVVRRMILAPLASVIRAANRNLSNDAARQSPVDVPQFCAERGEWGIPPVSLRMFSAADGREVVRRRRAHFHTLLEAVRDVDNLSPLFDALPDGVCPLYFPVLLEEPMSLVKFLQARGVGAHRFWEHFHERFPRAEHEDAVYLKTHVVILPIHQYVTDAAIDHVCNAVREWGLNGARRSSAA